MRKCVACEMCAWRAHRGARSFNAACACPCRHARPASLELASAAYVRCKMSALSLGDDGWKKKLFCNFCVCITLLLAIGYASALPNPP